MWVREQEAGSRLWDKHHMEVKLHLAGALTGTFLIFFSLQKEFPVPEQFKTVWDGSKLVTEPTEIAGWSAAQESLAKAFKPLYLFFNFCNKWLHFIAVSCIDKKVKKKNWTLKMIRFAKRSLICWVSRYPLWLILMHKI